MAHDHRKSGVQARGVPPTQQDPRAWALSEEQYEADMQAEDALHRPAERRRRKESAAAVTHTLHDVQSEMDQDVIDDGVGRFFLRDADEMEEIDASSVPASSHLSTAGGGVSMELLDTACSTRHVHHQGEASPSKEEGGLSIEARDTGANEHPASPANVSPYLEFQRAVSARSGLRVHVPKAALDGVFQRAQQQAGRTPLVVDESDSSQAMSSQVTCFADKMGACDGDGWCVCRACAVPTAAALSLAMYCACIHALCWQVSRLGLGQVCTNLSERSRLHA